MGSLPLVPPGKPIVTDFKHKIFETKSSFQLSLLLLTSGASIGTTTVAVAAWGMAMEVTRVPVDTPATIHDAMEDTWFSGFF